MLAKMPEDEGWGDLTQEDMSSTDPRAVARIRKLLHAAHSRYDQTVETCEQSRAMVALRRLTLGVILLRCSMRLHLERDHPDVTSLADRIFASHACGQPFLRDAPYKTWLQIWKPEEGSFLLLVAMTAKSRCADWLRSMQRDPDARRRTPAAATQTVGTSRPDLDFEFAEDERELSAAIGRLRPGNARDAIKARVCDGMTAKEYAEHACINETTAHMRMERGAKDLTARLVEEGVVGEGFGRNLITVADLTRRAQAKLAPGMGLGDVWKESKK